MSSNNNGDELVSRIATREARADDEQFLYSLYCSTRADEVAEWGLGAAQQDMFFRLQFTAQRRHYDIAFAGADHRIILFDGEPAGRILVFRSVSEIRLVDISLMAEHRGRGVGALLIRELLDEAASDGLSVTLHVEKHNRAARLYERLGFQVAGETGSHFKMEWRPR